MSRPEPDDLVWKALASPHRRTILDLLADRALTTGELAERFTDLSRFAVMQHLGVLQAARLVVSRKQGRTTVHVINAVPLVEAFERWVGPLAERAARDSLALKRFVESTGE